MAYTPYSDRPQWSDVIPLAQVEPADGLVPIMYSDEYSEAMGYFRSIVIADEKSERVLDLTEHIIRKNPAHYTVWQYRFDTLLHLRSDLNTELSLMNSFAEENLKSYQVWHHRLTLLLHLSPTLSTGLQEEIDFVHASLLRDTKNYHTWSYLHWIFSHFSALDAEKGGDRFAEEDWEKELAWCGGMLDSDLKIGEVEEEEIKGDGRNNSAWGWRWYLTMARGGVQGKKDVEKEISYTLSQIERIPHNASAWNYLRALYKQSKTPLSSILHVVSTYTQSTPPVPFALEWMADSALESKTKAGDEEAMKMMQELGERWDPMRRSYWRYRRGEVQRRAVAATA